MPRRALAWLILAIVAAFPMVYIGYELGWSLPAMLSVLVWGAVVAAVAVEIDRIG